MAPVLEVQELRDFLRDKVDLNVLIGKEESEDYLLAQAIADALDDYNSTPPDTVYTDENFPSKSLLKIGATLYILMSAGLQQSRNHLAYSDGGINVEVSEKTQLYQSWIAMFQRQWDTKKRDLKTQQNLKAGWGGVESPYGNTNGYRY